MANLLGVTTHMLRYYEKIGIIAPETDQESGYRYYSVVDTRRFNLCRNLFAAGIPLKECSLLLQDCDKESREAIIEKVINQSKRKIELEKMSQAMLRQYQAYSNIAEKDLGKVSVVSMPTIWRLDVSDNEDFYNDENINNEKQEWLDCQPASYWVSCIPYDSLKDYGSDKKIHYRYGLMIKEEDALKLNLHLSQNVEVIAGGKYLNTIHCKSGRDPWGFEDVSILMDYCKENNITSIGNAYSHIICSRKENNKIINYHNLKLQLFI